MAKRRSNGEGSLRRKPNGTYELALFDGYHPDGRKKMKYFYGSTQTEVKRKMREYQHAKESGMNTDTDQTFAEFAARFLELHQHRIKPVTADHYRHTLRLINEVFADRKLSSIKPMEVESFLVDLQAQGRSDSGVSHARGLFYMIMEAAEANDYVTRNPVRYAAKVRKRPPKKKEIFTVEEIRLILEKLDDTNLFHLGIKLMICTGLRTQELLALQPEHIAEEGEYLIVTQAVSMVHGTATVSTPKSNASCRRVPILENARPYALSLRNTGKKYIFSVGKEDAPCNPSTFRKAYRNALESINVRYLPPHNCRHTFVSMLYSANVDLATVQSIVGHSTTDMTQHYLTIDNSTQTAAVDKFAKLLSDSAPTEE